MEKVWIDGATNNTATATNPNEEDDRSNDNQDNQPHRQFIIFVLLFDRYELKEESVK